MPPAEKNGTTKRTASPFGCDRPADIIGRNHESVRSGRLSQLIISEPVYFDLRCSSAASPSFRIRQPCYDDNADKRKKSRFKAWFGYDELAYAL